MNLSDEAQLTPIPLDKAISSLSAILLDDGYYGFIHNFKIDIEEIPTIPPEIIIPLKARAWLDLTERRQTGEHVDKFDIKKHKNDIFDYSR
ncbi:MAG: hypothetical protein K9L23_21730 [Desulfotignum sp.]|nr:hypothetical protein [Desulfotignum sp.]